MCKQKYILDQQERETCGLQIINLHYSHSFKCYEVILNIQVSLKWPMNTELIDIIKRHHGMFMDEFGHSGSSKDKIKHRDVWWKRCEGLRKDRNMNAPTLSPSHCRSPARHPLLKMMKRTLRSWSPTIQPSPPCPLTTFLSTTSSMSRITLVLVWALERIGPKKLDYLQ